MHSLIVSIESTGAGDAFDLDVSLLTKLNVQRRDKEQKPDKWMHEHIQQHQTMRALQKYVKFCEQVNLSALASTSFSVVVTLSSRYLHDVTTVAAELERELQLDASIDTSLLRDDYRHEELALRSNQDWQTVLEYFDAACDADEVLVKQPVLTVIIAAFKEAHISAAMINMHEYHFAVRVLLSMSPTGVTAGKMVENFIAKALRDAEAEVPHDLELRVMRGITAFHDAKFSTSTLLNALQTIATCLAPRAGFFKTVDEIMAQQEVHSAKIDTSLKGRPRLSAIVSQLHCEHKAYHGTFESWVSNQRFSLNTSQRMQRFLYFCRVQVDGVLYDEITTQVHPAVWERARDSVVDQIDPTPLIHTIRMVRRYNENVRTLIDFRVHCLAGLTTTTRAQLTLANVLQLYIAAHQHESVRERCWRAVTNSWNFTIKSSIDTFIRNNTFEVGAVVRTLLGSIGN